MSDLGFNLPDGSAGENTDTSPDPDSLAEGFLKNIPENERHIVAKYVKDWDGGVTKKFQEIHGQYKPYKDLGATPEQLQAAYNLYQHINTDPIASFQTMQDSLIAYAEQDPKFKQQLIEAYGEEFFEEEMSDEELSHEQLSGIEDPRDAELAELRSKLEEFDGWRNEQEQSRVHAQEDEQFDALLQQMHNAYGDFDETWVMVQMASGKNPQEAIQAWNQFTEGIVSSRKTRPAPPIIGGQGGVPNDQVDVSKLVGKDRKNLIAQILEANAG